MEAVSTAAPAGSPLPAGTPPPSTARRFVPSRGQAFALHVALSLIVFSTLVAAMLLWWFPGELFLLDGGWQGLRLVAMVDLVLGPALTLILYKPGKPGLVLDMILIAAVQLGALGYGFVTTYQQRTVALVHAEGAFTTVSAKDVKEADAALRERDVEPRAIPALVADSGRAGATASVPLLMTPDPDGEDFGRYLADLFNGFPAPSDRNDQYVVLGGEARIAARHALTLDALAETGEREAVETALESHSLAAADVELHRFEARYADGIAIFDPEAVRIIDYVPTERRPVAAAATPAGTAAAESD